jgi:predicted metal-dependent phosphoesterase TrpH
VFGRTRFYYDLQVHTRRYSRCSSIDPEALIEIARRRGLDGLVLTEHEHRWSTEALEALRRRAGAPDFGLFAGCEVRTYHQDRCTGDLLVFGMEPPQPPCTIDEVCRQARRVGALVIAPHPLVPGQGIGEELHLAAIDALEVFNHRYRKVCERRQLLQTWRATGLPGVAGSDAHAPDEIGRHCTVFARRLRDLQELNAAIRAGQCRPWPALPPLFTRMRVR